MNQLFIALGFGVAAGIVDTLPMMLRKAQTLQIAAAFSHWVVAAILIT